MRFIRVYSTPSAHVSNSRSILILTNFIKNSINICLSKYIYYEYLFGRTCKTNDKLKQLIFFNRKTLF